MGKRANTITEYTVEDGTPFTVKEPSLRSMLELSQLDNEQQQAEAVFTYIHSWDGIMPEDGESILDIVPGRYLMELMKLLEDFFDMDFDDTNETPND